MRKYDCSSKKGEHNDKETEKTVAFADVWLSHTEKKWGKHWLKKILDKINFNKFRYRFEQLYDKENDRPAWDPISGMPHQVRHGT